MTHWLRKKNSSPAAKAASEGFDKAIGPKRPRCIFVEGCVCVEQVLLSPAHVSSKCSNIGPLAHQEHFRLRSKAQKRRADGGMECNQDGHASGRVTHLSAPSRPSATPRSVGTCADQPTSGGAAISVNCRSPEVTTRMIAARPVKLAVTRSYCTALIAKTHFGTRDASRAW